MKRTPIVCCAASSASSGSAPASVVLTKTVSRASGEGRKLSRVLATDTALFDATICPNSVVSVSAGVGGGG